MSTTCQVCNGAIPDGLQRDGHTALCTEVAVKSLRAQLAEANARAERADALLRQARSALLIEDEDNPILQDESAVLGIDTFLAERAALASGDKP